MERLLSTDEVAELLGVTSQTVRTYANSGEIQAALIGKYWKYKQEWVDAFIEKRRLLSQKEGVCHESL